MQENIRINRAILIGALFTLLIVIVDPMRVLVSKGSSLTSDYSTGAAFFYFFLIVLVNGLLGKANKKFALSAVELVIVFGMMMVGCAIPTWGFTLNLIPLLPGIYYYARPDWEESVIPFVRERLTVSDGNAVNWFFEGLPRGAAIPWDKWLSPLLLWFILIMAVYLLSILIMVIIRKRWIEEERLAYPLTIAPQKLAESKGHFPEIFRSRTFWFGIAIPAVIISIDCLHTYFPLFPSLELRRNIFMFRRTTSLRMAVFFEIIALTYFVPLDVSLGIWFFYLVMFVTTGFFNIAGLSHASPEPWVMGGLATGYMTMGAMMMMVFLMFWQERLFWKETCSDKKNYPLFTIAGVCFLVIVIWLAYAGLKVHHGIAFTVVAFLTFIGITRVVCQAGTAYARSGAVPAGMTLNMFGSESVGASGITALGLTSPWACDLRTMVMASVANFFKLGHVFKIHIKKLVLAGIIAVVLGLLGSAWSVINIAYRHGAINLGGWQFTGYVPYTVSWVKDYILHPYGFGRYQFSFLGIGGLGYMVFWLLRIKFPAFPLHPLGLTIASTWPITATWFSIFLGWLFKFMILKYGGQKTYRDLQPMFIGMIVGAFLIAGIWMFIDFATGIVPATRPIMGS